MLNLDTALVAELELRKRQGTDFAGTIEAKCVFEIGVPGRRWTGFDVSDGDFLACTNVADRMDVLAVCSGVPAIIGIGETAVIDEANGMIDVTAW